MAIHVAPFGSSDIGPFVAYLNFGVQNYLARLAVPFFFIASGFLLFRKTSLHDFDIQPSKRYVKRIFRLYVIWTLIYFPLSLRGFFSNEKGLVHAVLGYIRNCLFTGSYTQLWYLNALIFAVIIITVLLYKKVRPRHIIAMAACLYMIGLFAQSWFGFIEPLREAAPQVWSLLRLSKKVIATTRNGLFEGFLFVSIGMCFALCDIKVSRAQALMGFLASMAAMFVEVFLLECFDFAREHDMYLFLAPASFFMFCFVRQLQLPASPVYKALRLVSSLVFYSHLWVNVVVSKLLRMIDAQLVGTCLQFVLTVAFTIALSLFAIKLSELRHFKWVKSLYS